MLNRCFIYLCVGYQNYRQNKLPLINACGVYNVHMHDHVGDPCIRHPGNIPCGTDDDGSNTCRGDNSAAFPACNIHAARAVRGQERARSLHAEVAATAARAQQSFHVHAVR